MAEGQATKSDVAHMKREAREREQAYKQGLEDSSPDDGDGDGSSGGSNPSRTAGSKITFANSSQKLIVVAISITVIIALVESAHAPSGTKKASPANIIVGGFVAGSILLGMSYFLPEFASGLAIVAMLATVLDRGQPFWATVGNVTGGPLPTTSKGITSQSFSPPESGPATNITTIPNATTGQPTPFGNLPVQTT